MPACDLVATRIEVERDVASAWLLGPITDFVSKADFRVQGQRVDASGARFIGGTDADLANGVRVRVAGQLSAGTVVAFSVTFLR